MGFPSAPTWLGSLWLGCLWGYPDPWRCSREQFSIRCSRHTDYGDVWKPLRMNTRNGEKEWRKNYSHLAFSFFFLYHNKGFLEANISICWHFFNVKKIALLTSWFCPYALTSLNHTWTKLGNFILQFITCQFWELGSVHYSKRKAYIVMCRHEVADSDMYKHKRH